MASERQQIYLKINQVRERYGNCSAMWIERRMKIASFRSRHLSLSAAPTLLAAIRSLRLGCRADQGRACETGSRHQPRSHATGPCQGASDEAVGSAMTAVLVAKRFPISSSRIGSARRGKNPGRR